MRRHGLKKGLSLLLVFCMILSLLPMTALADEISEEPGAAVEEQSPASGDTTAAGTGEEQAGETGETGEATEPADPSAPTEPDTGNTAEPGEGETGEATEPTDPSAPTEPAEPTEPGEGDPSVPADPSTGEQPAAGEEEGEKTFEEQVGDELSPITGEKTPEQIAEEEALKAAEEERARQEAAAAEAAAKAEAEAAAAELKEAFTVEAKKSARDTGDDGFYKIVHLDAGRKYFSVDSIKAIIDNMADAGYNQLELYLSDNQGFRFALDDMNIETTYGTYDLSAALGEGPSGGDGSGEYLDEADMDEIIAYAKADHIEIVPCINTPGHMGAILEAFPEFRYSSSKSSIDLEDPEAVAFALAIVAKYADYFSKKGCDFFNIGADEYANDLSSTMGFESLYTAGKYQRFVDYLNAAAQIVINEGMTPRAFNDGIYYKNDTSYSINKAIQVCYWSSGWNGYNVASAATISRQGHDMINTHGDYYWVLGGYQCSVDKASSFAYQDFQGTSGLSADGAMFCIWCDVGNADGQDGGAQVVANTADVIAAFGATLPVPDTGNGTAEHPYDLTVEKNQDVLVGLKLGESCYLTMGKDVVWMTSDPDVLQIEAVNVSAAASTYALEESGDVTAATVKVTATGIGEATLTADASNFDVSVRAAKSKTVTVTVGGTTTVTVSGANYASTHITEEPSIATVEVTGTDGTAETTDYEKASVSCNTLISNNSNSWTAASGYYYQVDGNYYPVYAKRSSSGILIWTTYKYTWGYSTTSSADNVKEIQTQETESTSTTPNITVYTKTTTGGEVASTTITFTGVHVGTTSVIIGDTEYTINVQAENLSNVTPLTVEYWITNRQVTADGAESKQITAEEAYGESGVLLSQLIPTTPIFDNHEMLLWKGTLLTYDNHQVEQGEDKTQSGTDFTYIRYWDSQWAYSANGRNWTNVADGDQIVAYYLQKTKVTDEVTTQVVDWGQDYAEWKGDRDNRWFWDNYVQNGSKFVFLDFAVVYENGTQNPSSFPTDNTWFFHFDGCSAQNPRVLGAITFTESAEFEIWKVTVQDGTCTGYSSVSSFTPKYSGEEVEVWNVDTSTEEPCIESLTYTANRSGKLVRIYIRTKITEDSLQVRYVDQTTGQEFYNYGIAVQQGTYFDVNFKLNADQTLSNNTVTNILGVEQPVSAVLSTMPAIGGQYRYSNYTCTKVERSEDGKTVTLYYTFNDTHSFVVDFGLPLRITAADLGITGDWTSVTVTGAEYGTVKAGIGEGITYTPTSVMMGIETLDLTLTQTKDGSSTSSAQKIYIYPATTVYYEEGFMVSGGSKGTAFQTAEKVGDKRNVYGYDPAYNTMAHTTAELKEGADAEFTFTGTGVDIYADCSTDTGTVMIQVTDKNGAVEKLLVVNTAMLAGETTATTSAKQAVSAKNVPIASIESLSSSPQEHTVTITHVGNTKPVYLDGFRVHQTLKYNTAAYVTDGESISNMVELRDLVILNVNMDAANSSQEYKDQITKTVKAQVLNTGANAALITNVTNGAGINQSNLVDVLDKGPKNEIYLAAGETLVFNVDKAAQVGVKCLTDDAAGTVNGRSVTSQTDMFYAVNAGQVTITNIGTGTLAVTELKFCS